MSNLLATVWRAIASGGALALVLFALGIGPADGPSWAEAAEERVFDLEVAGGKLPEPLRRLRVKQGDSVRLRWRVDAPMVLHLHGYDIEKAVAPGEVAEFHFTAHATGRFPVNVHHEGSSHHGPPLTVLEVHPR